MGCPASRTCSKAAQHKLSDERERERENGGGGETETHCIPEEPTDSAIFKVVPRLCPLVLVEVNLRSREGKVLGSGLCYGRVEVGFTV
jgi:hypothetical protein